jgi:hypothetical protein
MVLHVDHSLISAQQYVLEFEIHRLLHECVCSEFLIHYVSQGHRHIKGETFTSSCVVLVS